MSLMTAVNSLHLGITRFPLRDCVINTMFDERHLRQSFAYWFFKFETGLRPHVITFGITGGQDLCGCSSSQGGFSFATQGGAKILGGCKCLANYHRCSGAQRGLNLLGVYDDLYWFQGALGFSRGVGGWLLQGTRGIAFPGVGGWHPHKIHLCPPCWLT